MEGTEYQKNALLTETEIDPDLVVRAAQTKALRLLHAGIGLATEAGEFLDTLKKHIYYGAELDDTNLKEEIGDVMWYVALACNAYGIDIGDVMQANIAKLQARYPDNFTSEDALNRDTANERRVLEGQLELPFPE